MSRPPARGESARVQAALALLAELARSAAPADVAFAAFHRRARGLSGAERHAVQARVQSWLRRRAALDWWLQRAGAKPLPRTRALAALLLLEGWTPSRLARVFGGAPGHPQRLRAPERALVTALAGRDIEQPGQPREVRLECPEWVLAELEPVFGFGLERELAALREPPPLDLRVNTLAATREQALGSLARAGVEATPTPISPIGLRLRGGATSPRWKPFASAGSRCRTRAHRSRRSCSMRSPGRRCSTCARALVARRWRSRLR